MGHWRASGCVALYVGKFLRQPAWDTGEHQAAWNFMSANFRLPAWRTGEHQAASNFMTANFRQPAWLTGEPQAASATRCQRIRDKLAWGGRAALVCVCMTSRSIWRFTAFDSHVDWKRCHTVRRTRKMQKLRKTVLSTKPELVSAKRRGPARTATQAACRISEHKAKAMTSEVLRRPANHKATKPGTAKQESPANVDRRNERCELPLTVPAGSRMRQ